MFLNQINTAKELAVDGIFSNFIFTLFDLEVVELE